MSRDPIADVAEVISRGGRTPWDVRIVAFYFYFFGSLGMLVGLLFLVGLTKSPEETPWRVLIDTVVLSSGFGQGMYTFLMSGCDLLCAWGLTRGTKAVWVFAMIYQVYTTVDAVFAFPRHPISTAIGTALGIALIGWLWYRRRFYGFGEERARE
jgi:uncharacterized membrane protein YczE